MCECGGREAHVDGAVAEGGAACAQLVDAAGGRLGLLPDVVDSVVPVHAAVLVDVPEPVVHHLGALTAQSVKGANEIHTVVSGALYPVFPVVRDRYILVFNTVADATPDIGARQGPSTCHRRHNRAKGVTSGLCARETPPGKLRAINCLYQSVDNPNVILCHAVIAAARRQHTDTTDDSGAVFKMRIVGTRLPLLRMSPQAHICARSVSVLALASWIGTTIRSVHHQAELHRPSSPWVCHLFTRRIARHPKCDRQRGTIRFCFDAR